MAKDIFQRRLRSYSILAGSLLATKFSADAQILYTDIVPDDTLNPYEYIELDLNNDSIVDFYPTQAQNPLDYGRGGIICNTWSGSASLNSVAGVATEGSFSIKSPFKLSQDDSISSNLEWIKPPGFVGGIWFQDAYNQVIFYAEINSEGYFGYWQNGVVNGYVGLRINVNGNQYYGWARLDVDSAAYWMIVKDYAINLTPNSPILAGEGMSPLGINESGMDLSIYPNPASSKLFLSCLNENFNNGEISVLDFSGRKIFSQKISSHQNEIDVSSLPNGVYLLELKNEDEMITKKFEVSR